MAIVTKDQGQLQFGSGSQPRQPDTYTGLTRPPASNNADALFSALSGLSTSFARRQQKQQQETEQSNEMLLGTWVDEIERDKMLGLSDEAIKGKIPATASPLQVGKAQQEIGKRQFQSEYDAMLPSLLADPTYQNNAGAIADLEARERARIFEATKDSPMKRNGALTSLNGFIGSLRGQLTQSQSQAINDANEQAWLDSASPSSVKIQNFALKASQKVNVPSSWVTYLVAQEGNHSGQEDLVTSVKGATAAGLTQITDGTWSHLVEKYGKEYGLTMDNRMDGEMNAIGAALYAKENADFFKSYAGKDPSLDVLAGSHFLGPGGFKKVYQADPSTPMDKVITGDAYSNNRSRFVKNGKVLTAGEFREDLRTRVDDNDIAHDYTYQYDGVPKFQMNRDSFSSKNYKWTDLKNNGEYGGDGEIDGRLIRMIDDVTDKFGRKLKFTSSYRDKDYNANASYTKDSQHSHGNAMDIDVSGMNDADKSRLVALFTAHGARGIGHYDNGTIHVDLREGKGKQADGMALWYHNQNGEQDHTAANPWFALGIDQGRQMRDTDTVPIPTHNNTPQSGFQLAVYDGVRRGYTVKQSTDKLYKHYLNIGMNTRDVSVFDQIPVELLNVEQQAGLYAARQQVVDLVNQENVNRIATTERSRNAAEKAQQDLIMQAMADGKPIDALKMSNISFQDADGKTQNVVSSDVYKWAQSLERDYVDPETSVVNMQQWREDIEQAVVRGNFKDFNKKYLGIDSEQMQSNETYRKYIAGSDKFNKQESVELLKSLDQDQQVKQLLDEQSFNRVTRDLTKTMDITEKTNFRLQGFRQIDPNGAAIIAEVRDATMEKFNAEYMELIKTHLDSQDELGPLTAIKKREYQKAAVKEAQQFYLDNMKSINDLMAASVKGDQMVVTENGVKNINSLAKPAEPRANQSAPADIPADTPITFDFGKGEVIGKFVGKTPAGLLKVRDASGLINIVDPGQVKTDLSGFQRVNSPAPAATADQPIPGVTLTDGGMTISEDVLNQTVDGLSAFGLGEATDELSPEMMESERASYPRPYEQVGIAKPGSAMANEIARQQNAPVNRMDIDR